MIPDEEKYLLDLEGTGQYTMNLTDIPTEELLSLKKEAEKTMHHNYYRYRRMHPYLLIKDYYHKLLRFIRYIKVNGIKKSIKNIYKTLRNNPELIFQAE